MLRAENGKVLVTFIRSHGPYQRGAVAGFNDDEAARLVSIRAAEYTKSKAQKEAEKVAADKKADETERKPAAKKTGPKTAGAKGRKGGRKKAADENPDQNVGVSVGNVNLEKAPAEVSKFFKDNGDRWVNAPPRTLISVAKQVTDDPIQVKGDAIAVLKDFLKTNKTSSEGADAGSSGSGEEQSA